MGDDFGFLKALRNTRLAMAARRFNVVYRVCGRNYVDVVVLMLPHCFKASKEFAHQAEV